MSIAQLEVAGEGGCCAASHESVNASVTSPKEDHADADAFAVFPTDETKLPWQVHHAQHRALSARGLPKRARDLLAEFARTVDYRRPLGSIFAKRQRLSQRAQMPIRTLSRALADLEAAGLVTRQQQRRLDNGPMRGSYDGVRLNLTEKAAALLGLIKSDAVAHGSTPATSGSEGFADAHVAHGSGDVQEARNVDAEAFEQPQAKVAHGAIYGDLSPASFQKRQSGQVPEDLQRLLPLGFSKFLIFAMMRQAREQGKRLSDVVEASWHGLKRAAQPICYLRKLIWSEVDFGYQVRQRNAERNAARDAAAERAAADVLARQVAGQVFVDATGDQLLEVDADGQGASVTLAQEGIARRLPSTWAIQFARSLRAGRVRVAEEGDREAFVEARRRRTAAPERLASVPRVLTSNASAGLASMRATLRGSAPAGHSNQNPT